METKTYQKLSQKNLNAAIAIAKELKVRKCLSDKDIKVLWNKNRGIHHPEFPLVYQNYITTFKFLIDHNIMTLHNVNGLIVYVATQKCVHSKIENMFVEYQTILNTDINKAIEYQRMNNGKVPYEMEGNVIAENILKLNKKSAEFFVQNYKYFLENHYNGVDKKYVILSLLREMPEIKKVGHYCPI